MGANIKSVGWLGAGGTRGQRWHRPPPWAVSLTARTSSSVTPIWARRASSRTSGGSTDGLPSPTALQPDVNSFRLLTLTCRPIHMQDARTRHEDMCWPRKLEGGERELLAPLSSKTDEIQRIGRPRWIITTWSRWRGRHCRPLWCGRLSIARPPQPRLLSPLRWQFHTTLRGVGQLSYFTHIVQFSRWAQFWQRNNVLQGVSAKKAAGPLKTVLSVEARRGKKKDWRAKPAVRRQWARRSVQAGPPAQPMAQTPGPRVGAPLKKRVLDAQGAVGRRAGGGRKIKSLTPSPPIAWAPQVHWLGGRLARGP